MRAEDKQYVEMTLDEVADFVSAPMPLPVAVEVLTELSKGLSDLAKLFLNEHVTNVNREVSNVGLVKVTSHKGRIVGE